MKSSPDAQSQVPRTAGEIDSGGWRPVHFARAAELLEECLQGAAPADRLMDRYFRSHSNMGSKDRGRVAEAVYACLRHRRLFAALAGSDELDAPSLVAVHLVKDLGFSARALERLVPAVKPFALMEQIRSADPANLPFAVRHSLPEWLGQELLDIFSPAEASALAEALNRPAPVDLRVNTLKVDRDTLANALAQAGFPCEPTPWSPVGLRRANRAPLFNTQAFRDGWFELQDEGSQSIALLTAPRRRETIVDYCAGGGGKTLHLGALMGNTGSLWALDVSARRLEKLRPRLKRAGLDNVRTMAIESETDPRILAQIGQADRVLVDAPCSGTGTLRRNPDIKWRGLELAQLNRIQASILDAAAHLVRPGGRLIYATCSLLSQENQAVVQSFLARAPDFTVIEVQRLLPLPSTLPSPVTPEGFLQLLPHRHGTDGFFAAVLERRA